MKVRFAPSPTGSLHIGNALGAVANRNFGGTMLLRIDDTDPARNVAGGEEAILDDLRWLGIDWDEGPVRQSDRLERYREAAAGLPQRVAGVMLLRDDGSATYHLASVVDDADFGITHVIRGNDHRPNESLHRALAAALGVAAPEYVHHGLILGADGKKISKRAEGGSIAGLRDEGDSAPKRCGRTWWSSGCRGTTCISIWSGSVRCRSMCSLRSRTRNSRRASGSHSSSHRPSAALTT